MAAQRKTRSGRGVWISSGVPFSSSHSAADSGAILALLMTRALSRTDVEPISSMISATVTFPVRKTPARKVLHGIMGLNMTGSLRFSQDRADLAKCMSFDVMTEDVSVVFYEALKELPTLTLTIAILRKCRWRCLTKELEEPPAADARHGKHVWPHSGRFGKTIRADRGDRQTSPTFEREWQRPFVPHSRLASDRQAV